MFNENTVHFMNAYYKETEKLFRYLLADNKPKCYVYYLVVNGAEPICVETKPAGQKSRDYVCHLGKKVNNTKFAKRT